MGEGEGVVSGGGREREGLVRGRGGGEKERWEMKVNGVWG